MPNKTVEKIKALRPDLSDYFFHFTKSDSAKETLRKIIDDMSIKSFNPNNTISLTDAPLLSMIGSLLLFEEYPQPMFAPYGIAIKKGDKRLKDLRPVIYGPEEERELFDEKVLWRYVNICEEYDNTYMREWRCHCSEIRIDPNRDYVIFRSDDDIVDLIAEDYDVQVEQDEELGFDVYHLREQKLKGISIQTIIDRKISNSHEIENILKEQSLGKSLY